MTYHALIMAGGGGTRLWPLSRRTRPKQVLKLAGDRTMFQHAVDRIVPAFAWSRIWVVTGEEHVDELRRQAPEVEHFIVEPLGRGTAPAIGLGAAHIRRRDPEAVMVVLTADHYIRDVEEFRRALGAARQVAEAGHLVTLGIHPGFASTGYGYIEQGDRLDTVEDLTVYRAARFIEKPNAERAARMVDAGSYAWNSGMFIWRVSRIMDEFERQMPRLYTQLVKIERAIGTPDYERLLAKIWPRVERETIDYGVMEGATDVTVLPVDIGWSDVGNWSSMRDILPADADGNVSVGDHVAIDSRDTIVYSQDRLVATIGLEDVIVVDAGDAVLVCPRAREQEVRAMVRKLTELGRSDVL